MPLSKELNDIRDQFIGVMKSVVTRLVSMKVIPPREPDKISQLMLLQWKQDLQR